MVKKNDLTIHNYIRRNLYNINMEKIFDDNNINKFLNYIKNKTLDLIEINFCNDFYKIFLDYNKESYIIDSDLILKWLIYSEKSHFKRFFTKFLNKDKDYNIIYTKGNKYGIKYLFNLESFKKIILHYSLKNKNLKFENYLNNLEKYITDYKYNYFICNDLKIKELKNIRIPVIYIYNTDITKNIPILKIGISENLYERINCYNVLHPHGLFISYEEIVDKKSLKIAETFLHNLLKLSGFLVKNECFQLSIEEAKLWIKRISDLIKIAKNKEITDNKIIEENKQINIIPIQDIKPLNINNDASLIPKHHMTDNFDIF